MLQGVQKRFGPKMANLFSFWKWSISSKKIVFFSFFLRVVQISEKIKRNILDPILSNSENTQITHLLSFASLFVCCLQWTINSALQWLCPLCRTQGEEETIWEAYFKVNHHQSQLGTGHKYLYWKLYKYLNILEYLSNILDSNTV